MHARIHFFLKICGMHVCFMGEFLSHVKSVVFAGVYIRFGKNQAKMIDKERLPQYFILNLLRDGRGERI